MVSEYLPSYQFLHILLSKRDQYGLQPNAQLRDCLSIQDLCPQEPATYERYSSQQKRASNAFKLSSNVANKSPLRYVILGNNLDPSI